MIVYHIIRLYRTFGSSIVRELNIYGGRLKSNYKDLLMIDGLLNHFLELRLRKIVAGLGWGRYYI